MHQRQAKSRFNGKKFPNKKIEYQGRFFDSLEEMRVWKVLNFAFDLNVLCQPEFIVFEGEKYTLKKKFDFWVEEIDLYVEVKGEVLDRPFLRALQEIYAINYRALPHICLTVNHRVIESVRNKHIIKACMKHGLRVCSHEHLPVIIGEKYAEINP